VESDTDEGQRMLGKIWVKRELWVGFVFVRAPSALKFVTVGYSCEI
jgi:hypothetical protein